MKGLAVILLLLIIASLGSALASMSSAQRGPEQSLRVVHALTARIALSVGLFVLLIGSYYMGWIQPHSLH